MSGFCGMTEDGFMACPKCGHQWHGPACDIISDNGCDCHTSRANPSPDEYLADATVVEE